MNRVETDLVKKGGQVCFEYLNLIVLQLKNEKLFLFDERDSKKTAGKSPVFFLHQNSIQKSCSAFLN